MIGKVYRLLKDFWRNDPKGETSNVVLHKKIDTDDKGHPIRAYPGPDVVEAGRVEHLPLHCHITYPGKKYRVGFTPLKELSGQHLPKDLARYLERNWDDLLKKTKDVFYTGKID